MSQAESNPSGIPFELWDGDFDTGITTASNTLSFHLGGATPILNAVQWNQTDGFVFNVNNDALGFQVKGETEDYALYFNSLNGSWGMLTNQTEFNVNGALIKPTLTMKRKDDGSSLNQILHSASTTAARSAFNAFARDRAGGAVINGDRLGVFQCYAHDGTNYRIGGAIQFVVSNTVSTGVIPTEMQVRLLNTAGSLVTSTVFESDGAVAFRGTGATDKLTIFNNGGLRGNRTQSGDATADFIFSSQGFVNMLRVDTNVNQVNIGTDVQGSIMSADADDLKVTLNRANLGANLIVESSASGVNLWETDTTNDLINHNGGLRVKTTRITADYTILVSDLEIYCDTDGGTFTATLPPGVDGQKLRIINCGSSGHDVTIAPNGTDLLEGVNASKGLPSKSIVILTYEDTEGWW